MGSSLALWMAVLPVLAYACLDAFAGRKTGLWGAVALGAAELLYSLIRFRGLDYLSLLAFLLLAGFAALSLRTRDDLWFKLQGSLANAALAAAILAAWYLFHRAVLVDAAEKYYGLDRLAGVLDAALRGRPAAASLPDPDRAMVAAILLRLNHQLPWWLLGHAAVAAYAAWRWGKWPWVLVSVPGLFLVLFLAAQVAALPVLAGAAG